MNYMNTWICILLACGSNCFAEEGWPMFRGPRGDGSVAQSRLPLRWSETEHVRWKTAIPHLGWSTPVIEEGRIWLTSATTNGTDYFAYCVDAQTGKILQEMKLFHCDTPEPLGNSVNGYASPSAAIEKGRVFVHYGSYGTACLDAKTGALLWKREDLKCRHYRGPGSSVFLYRDSIILTLDGVDQQYVIALDKTTGKTLWRTDRAITWKDMDDKGVPFRDGDMRKGFTTPLLITVAGKEQLISPGSSVIFSYDPANGKELWRVESKTHTPVVCPVFAEGLVMVVTGHGPREMLAIRPDGSGNVTGTHVAWRIAGKDVPDTPSPVVANGLLYMLSDQGILTCIDVKTGEVIWRERAAGNCVASLIYDGTHIYLPTLSGKTLVLQPGRTFEKKAENTLDAGFMASPAVLGNALILRTKTHLYRIE